MTDRRKHQAPRLPTQHRSGVAKAGTSKRAAEDRRALFVEAYCTNGRNATAAAKAAGYSAKTAYSAGCRLLKDVEVQKLVAQSSAEAFDHAQRVKLLTAEEVLEDLAQAKRFDPAKMYGEDGRLLPVKDMPEEVRLHLEGVEVEEIAAGRGEDRVVIGHTSKVRFPKKTAIREQAMKHFGLYELDNRQKPAPRVNVGVLTVKPDGMHFEKVRARALQRPG